MWWHYKTLGGKTGSNLTSWFKINCFTRNTHRVHQLSFSQAPNRALTVSAFVLFCHPICQHLAKPFILKVSFSQSDLVYARHFVKLLLRSHPVFLSYRSSWQQQKSSTRRKVRGRKYWKNLHWLGAAHSCKQNTHANKHKKSPSKPIFPWPSPLISITMLFYHQHSGGCCSTMTSSELAVGAHWSCPFLNPRLT